MLVDENTIREKTGRVRVTHKAVEAVEANLRRQKSGHAVTRIRTWVVTATTWSTNHYTITARNPAAYAAIWKHTMKRQLEFWWDWQTLSYRLWHVLCFLLTLFKNLLKHNTRAVSLFCLVWIKYFAKAMQKSKTEQCITDSWKKGCSSWARNHAVEWNEW